MSSRHFWYFCTVGALALTAWAASAQPATNLDNALIDAGIRPSNLRILSPTDHDLFTRAFAAANKGDWNAALTLGNQGQDSTARQLLQWRYVLDQASGAKFDDIAQVIKYADGWPLRSTLYARAEAAITPDMRPAEIIQWFGARAPASSLGKVRLGEALIATGENAKGAALIRQGWSTGSFDDFTENSILAKDGALLSKDDDKARLDALLWRNELSPAKRQMARVDAATVAVAQARIALASGLSHARPFLAKVPGSTDPTLLYDWARQLRIDHQDNAAHAKLLSISAAKLARDHPARWWAEANVEARDALGSGDAKTALALVDHAKLPVGDEFSEQQFLGGFITLRFLKEPSRALTYFRNLGANVSRPISKSRAEYWQGRAYEAMGDVASAYVHYRLAAAYPETFYGQLGQARTESQPVLHVKDTQVEPAPKAEIETDPLLAPMKVLADLGLANDLRLFADREASANPEPRHLKQVLQSLSDWGFPEIALRQAKNASYAGTPLVAFAYPTKTLPAYPASGAPPPPALVLALIRQETEFDPFAVSGAGARGLMQMMPASARMAAKTAGLPYRPDAMMSDVNYNMQLGMVEFAGHFSDWGGSYILATAAYNAGPSNVRRWLSANGDPRTGTDPIDWIEQISFSETRNYVQRVLENMEVYKSRLAGRDQPLTILADLYAPATPPATPVLSPPVSASAVPGSNAN